MKRVVIAYDGSPAADAAIHDLVHAALPDQLDVTVISVADVYLPPEAPPAPASSVAPPVIHRAREKALCEVEAHRALAARACARIHTTFPKWKCTPLAVADSPGWAIVQHAREPQADLVIVGSKSHSRLERLFLGSVAHKVLAEAPCSVRVARHVGDAHALRIIVAVDGSRDSRAALHSVAARRWRTGTEFRLVTVVDPKLETAVTWPGFLPEEFVQAGDQSGREWIARMMESAAKILHDAGLPVSNYSYDGDPKDVLVRVSDEWKAHAIFLGARGLHHGDRLYVGTAASSVATRAHCSVEVVRPRG